MASGAPLQQPTLGRVLLESRAVLELGAFAAATPALQLAPKGDGHPVLVLPGLAATDESTRPLRWFLRNRGYQTHGWRLGRNTGPTSRVRTGLRDRVRAIADEHGRAISLVGWSLGGIYAREIARMAPDAVRQVITLGSPFRSLDSTTTRSDVPLQDAPGDVDHSSRLRRDVGAGAGGSLRVPTTAVYTRTDGVVPWQLCVERPGPRRESVEVWGSHIGLGHNPSVLVVVADRLAQPEGTWAPFSPTPHLAALFPRPTAVAA
jgi:pimeloyl-ACP methyl ester carboxylesterase